MRKKHNTTLTRAPATRAVCAGRTTSAPGPLRARALSAVVTKPPPTGHVVDSGEVRARLQWPCQAPTAVRRPKRKAAGAVHPTDVNNMAEPGKRTRARQYDVSSSLSAAATGAGRAAEIDIYLVAQELHLALGQLFALVQLLNPLVEFLQGRFIVHNTNVKRRRTKINRPFLRVTCKNELNGRPNSYTVLRSERKSQHK